MSKDGQRGPALHIVLVTPEIPQNTGNIGRLCVGLDCPLHLVRPLGFDIGEKRVRRAGLDYWPHLSLRVHDDIGAFWQWAEGRRMHFFSSHGSAGSYVAPRYDWGDVLVFGRESDGLPEDLLATEPSYSIPMVGPTRSLNLSNAVAIVAYEATRQIRPTLFRSL
jgi:tRNA (cytidine/uridine-2'-O-)-methyltransferase